MAKKATKKKKKKMHSQINWLSDAPMFIDSYQIGILYDAIVRPDSNCKSITLSLTEENTSEISGKLNLGAGITTNDLGALITGFFTFLKPNLEASVEGTKASTKKKGAGEVITLTPIDNPQRQLFHLTLHYLTNNTDQYHIVSDVRDDKWREPETILKLPRPLVFIDLPSIDEAKEKGLMPTKIIPTACEFENGNVIEIFRKFQSKSKKQPKYPGSDNTPAMIKKRKEYWKWFNKTFKPTSAMRAVEKAGHSNGKISWIDYRMTLTDEGDSLHLHCCPRGEYDTGIFAYNLINRGFKQGLRIIGTLKSKPDLNVLAIYEK